MQFKKLGHLTIKSSSLIRSEFLLTNLKELATTGTSSFDRSEHFSANFVLELPILCCQRWWLCIAGLGSNCGLNYVDGKTKKRGTIKR